MATLTIPKLRVNESAEIARKEGARWILSKRSRSVFSAHEETEDPKMPGFWLYSLFGGWSTRKATAQECVQAIECRMQALTAPR